MAIWIIRQSPRSDPKFHQTEMFEGAGKSTSASLAIFRRGCVFRSVGWVIIACWVWLHHNGDHLSH